MPTFYRSILLSLVLALSGCNRINDPSPLLQEDAMHNAGFKYVGELPFDWRQVNRYPIQNARRLDGGFAIEAGYFKVADGNFPRTDPDVYEALRSQQLLPEHSSEPLMYWSIDAMDDYLQNPDSEELNNGIFRLDMQRLYRFSFAGEEYLLAGNGTPHTNEFFHNWGPYHDGALLLFRMEGKFLKLLIGTPAKDLDGESTEAFGDLDLDGRLEFVHFSLEYFYDRPIFAYELNPYSGQFESTGKFLKWKLEMGEVYVNYDSSSWY